MRRERLQNHIAGSVFTLPVCAVVAVLMWWLPVKFEAQSTLSAAEAGWGNRIIAFTLMVLATCILVEMNNRNLLLRIRSRLVSSTWLIASATIPLTHVYSEGLAAAVCVAASLYLLFFTYQKRECQVNTFHWALLVGVGSIFVPHVIVFLLLFLWYQIAFLRSMSLRSFCAALVGVLFPLCLWAAYWIVKDDYTKVLMWCNALLDYQLVAPENYLSFTLQQVASWGLVTLLGLFGAVHYLNTSYNDRIQVRMLLYILTCQFFVLEAFVCLQPQHLETLMPMLMVTAAPLIAHFFTLTYSWFTNTLFILSVFAFGALAYLNYCMPSILLTSL